jgi:hydrogenase maturation protease
MSSRPKILVYGYGNPGRQDDALGIRFTETVRSWADQGEFPDLHTDMNYQLNIEDALTVSEFDIVLFADAEREQESNPNPDSEPNSVSSLPNAFKLRKISPELDISFSTHILSPGAVLALCGQMGLKTPVSYLITIRGYKWEPNGVMTAQATDNLMKALEYIRPFLVDPLNNPI